MGLWILILIHVLVLAGGTAVTLLLPDTITPSLVISLVFCDIAYLVFAESHAEQRHDNGLFDLFCSYIICFPAFYCASPGNKNSCFTGDRHSDLRRDPAAAHADGKTAH